MAEKIAQAYASRIVQLERDVAHWRNCHDVADDLIVELRARIAQVEKLESHWKERCKLASAEVERLTAENAGLREALQDSLECNDSGRHCEVCHTNMRAALARGGK